MTHADALQIIVELRHVVAGIFFLAVMIGLCTLVRVWNR